MTKRKCSVIGQQEAYSETKKRNKNIAENKETRPIRLVGKLNWCISEKSALAILFTCRKGNNRAVMWSRYIQAVGQSSDVRIIHNQQALWLNLSATLRNFPIIDDLMLPCLDIHKVAVTELVSDGLIEAPNSVKRK